MKPTERVEAERYWTNWIDGMIRLSKSNEGDWVPYPFAKELATELERVTAAFPDIGADPLKLDGEERTKRMDEQVIYDITSKAASVQQTGVPDQTALVWRFDLSKLHERAILDEARLKFARDENADLKRQVEELKAEIEKVNSFREQLRAKHHQTGFTLYEINEQNAQLTAENDQLRAQLAEATKDKERLDWLEKKRFGRCRIYALG